MDTQLQLLKEKVEELSKNEIRVKRGKNPTTKELILYKL